jgi:hypothetical protein
MIGSPILQELTAARTRENLMAFFDARFGSVPRPWKPSFSRSKTKRA